MLSCEICEIFKNTYFVKRLSDKCFKWLESEEKLNLAMFEN